MFMKKTLLVIFFLVLFSKLQAQTIYYVDVAVAGSGNGLSWATASNDLQLIINTASDGDQIWIKEGIYQRDVGLSFFLNKNVSLYGGFPKILTPTFEDRNPNLYKTVLKGNESRVLEVLGNSNPIFSSTIIDGLILSDGYYSYGAGLYASQSNATYRNLIIKDNISFDGYGGGVLLSQCNSTFYQVLILNNTTLALDGYDGDAAGMKIFGGVNNLINSVIVFNHAEGFIGGIWVSGGVLNITNSIIYGNVSEADPILVQENNNFKRDNFNITNSKNSILQNSRGSDYYIEGHVFSYYGNDLGGNIDEAPIFNDDYSLNEMSHGINDGDNQVFENNPLLLDIDFFKNERIIDIVDIGISEYQIPMPNVLYVKEGGTGNGFTWESATGNLQLAMDRQLPGNQVWVATGTYFAEPHDFSLGNYFRLREGVKVYGGFPASGNPTFLDRDFESTPTILTAYNSIVLGNFHPPHKILSSETVLDGFSITSNGPLSYAFFDSYSNASYFNIIFKNIETNVGIIEVRRVSNVSFTDCKIVNNSTDYSNYSIIYLHSNATATFTRCEISENNSDTGNIMTLRNNCSAIFYNCNFKNNIIPSYSNVVYTNNCSLKFVDTVFENNGISQNNQFISNGSVISVDGDLYTIQPLWTHPLKVSFDRCILKNNNIRAIYARGMLKDTLTLNNTLIYGNIASDGAGLKKETSINVYMTNVTMAANIATLQNAGGIIIAGHDGVNEIRNSIVYNNSAPSTLKKDIYLLNPTSFKNSLLAKSGGSLNWNALAFTNFNNLNYAVDLGGNLDSDPMFINISDENFRLFGESPAVDSGINTVFDLNQIPNLSEITLDLDGNSRIQSGIVDMGAFEFNPDNLSTVDLKYENYIKIYPNPANDFVYIETEQFDFFNVTIFSIDGKLITKSTSKVIDVSNYSKGIYIFQIELSNQMKYSKRIIVK